MGTTTKKKNTETTTEITAKDVCLVIVAGGNGTRLFPISHPDCPKQFCRLTEDTTFIQDSCLRFEDCGIDPKRIVIVVTNDKQYQHALEQTEQLGIIEPNILLIDPKYGYAGAMVVADNYVAKHYGDPVVIHTPADQYVERGISFKEAVAQLIASAGKTPTILGVEKSDINTIMGCGHAKFADGSGMIRKVTGFIEKPDRELAEHMMREGGSRVNTGICAWRPSHIPAKLRDITGELATDALMNGFKSLNVILGAFRWFDCGTLDSFWGISRKTPNHQNASLEANNGGKIHRYECRGSLFTTIPDVEIYASHVKDAAVAVNKVGDKLAICVVARSASQQVRSLAEDFDTNRGVLEHHFTLGGINNRVARTNCCEEIYGGFVGVSDYTISVIKTPESHYIVTVSKDSSES